MPEPEARSTPSTNALPFVLLGSRLAVIVDEPPKEIGGIIIPDKVRDRPSSGVIVAASESLSFIPEDLIVGRRVLFGESTGIACEVGGQRYLVLEPGDLLGVMPTGTPAPFGEAAS